MNIKDKFYIETLSKNILNKFSYLIFYYTYTFDIESIKHNYIEILTKEIAEKSSENLSKSNSTIIWTLSHMFSIKNIVVCTINKNESGLHIHFKLTSNSYRISTLFFILAGALFSNFSLHIYFIFSISSIIALFIIFRLYYNTIFNSLLSNILFTNKNSEELSEEQIQWINNKNSCPACGNEITIYDEFCKECGIFIRKIERIKPFTSTKDIHITYTFKKDEKI